MATKKLAATVKAPKTPLTPEQRAARKEALRVQRAAEQEAQREAIRARERAFEEHRDVHWNQMWAKALRLALLVANNPEFRDSHSWWFGDFDVNAQAQHFYLEDTGSLCITRDKLHPGDVERINEALDTALTWYTEYLDKQEQERLAAIRKQELRHSARAKLTPEEQEALGLPRY